MSSPRLTSDKAHFWTFLIFILLFVTVFCIFCISFRDGMLERKQQQREKKYKDSCIKAVYSDVMASENGMSDSTMTFTGTLIPSKNKDFFCLSLNDDNTNLVLFENHSPTELDAITDVRKTISVWGTSKGTTEYYDVSISDEKFNVLVLDVAYLSVS